MIYINEIIRIPERHGIKVKVFADDVKIYLKIVNNVDFVQLQNALDSLCSWANMWQLPISVDKCYVLSVGKVVFSPTISINDHTLPTVSTARDLGITVTSNFSSVNTVKNSIKCVNFTQFLRRRL